jgi:hypothetical protein
MEIKRDEERRKSFRARHKCSDAKIKQHQNIGLVKCGLIHQYLKF